MTLKFPYSLMRLRKGKSPDDIESMFGGRKLPWVQKKYDGHLVQIKKKGNSLRVASRKGNSLNSRLKPIIDKLARQFKRDGVYIGELISLDGKKHSLSAVQSIASSGPKRANEIVEKGDVRIALFDKIESDGRVTAAMSYDERFKDLESSVAKRGPAFVVTRYPWSKLDHATRLSLREGGEGVVVKDPDGAYKIAELGKNERKGSQWKLKAPGVKAQSDDFILSGYQKGKEKLIFDVAQYDDGELVVVGKLSGLDKKTEKSVAKRVKKGENVVVEASYQEQLPSGKYRHLAWVRLRPDKPENSVTMKHKNSKDLEKIKRSASSRKNPDLTQMFQELDEFEEREDLNTLYIRNAVESDFDYRKDRNGNDQKYGLQSSVIGQLCPTNIDDEVYVAQYRTALDEVFFVRIEHSRSEGWTANVFKKQKTPFLSQLIERDELVNLLDDAVDYMKYLGTSESYIERSDRLTDDELIEHWAVWYTWYRLVPWMVYPGEYKNPRYKDCKYLWSYEEGNYFAEDEYLYGPYVPTVGYGDYDLGSVSLDYPVKRWKEIRDGKEAPWNVDSAPNEMAETNEHIMLVYENESNFAEWVTRKDGGVRVPRPDAMTLVDDADLIGNLTGPLSPFGAFFEKGAGGLSYYWKGVVDYGEPPGEDTVRLQEEEAKRSEGRGGAAGVRVGDAPKYEQPMAWEGGPPVGWEGDARIHDFPDEIPPGEEGSGWDFISNPRPSREGFIPGFTYQLSDIGQAEYVISMWLNRYYLKSESLRRSDIGGAFRPETKPSLMGFSSDGQYQMWDSIGFAHETMLLTRTPGGDWERGGAPSSVTKAQKSRRAKVAPYQRADDTENNPSVLRGQQFDYIEFYVEAVDFTKPLTWVKDSRTPEDLATNIRDAIKRASRLSNPSRFSSLADSFDTLTVPEGRKRGAYSEARGMSEIPNIVGEAMREFSGQNSTRLFNFDRAKTMAEVDNKARGINSNIPGAGYVGESGKVPLEPCQAGDYYLITNKESKRSFIYEAVLDPSDASKCILFRNEIGKEFEEQLPISRKEVGKYRNVQFMRFDKDIFTPGPDGTPVFVEIKDLLTLNYFSDNPEVKRDLVDEIRLHNANEQIADIVWVKQGGSEPKDKGWVGWVQLPSGAGLQVPMEELMLGLRPYGYSGKEYYWDDRLLNRGGVDLDSEEKEYLINRWQDAMYDYSEQVQEGQSTGMSGLENPSRNPCLGLHVHSDDLDKIKSLVETRQNPGFVSRMVKKHKKLEG